MILALSVATVSAAIGFLESSRAMTWFIDNGSLLNLIMPPERLILERIINHDLELTVFVAGANILTAVVSAIELYYLLKRELVDIHNQKERKTLRQKIVEELMEKDPERWEHFKATAAKLRIGEDKLIELIEPELLDLITQRPILVDARAPTHPEGTVFPHLRESDGATEQPEGNLSQVPREALSSQSKLK
jgi:hypothetical protein